MCNGRESVHCSEAGEGHKGQWHVTKEMIDGFGICVNFFAVKSHEDFCWLFLPCVHKSKTHTRCIDSMQHSAFKCLLLLGSETSFLPLFFFFCFGWGFFFACKGKNLLLFLQAKLCLPRNASQPFLLVSRKQ